MTLIDIPLLLLAVPAGLACAYLMVLTLLSSAPLTPPRSSRRLRFDVIVPAHNEEAVIARTVASLTQIDWPIANVRIWVVADNCDDFTAACAQ